MKVFLKYDAGKRNGDKKFLDHYNKLNFSVVRNLSHHALKKNRLLYVFLFLARNDNKLFPSLLFLY